MRYKVLVSPNTLLPVFDEYKSILTSFQIPAIIEHFQTLENKLFLDLGCGDIVLGEFQEIIGRPMKYFVQDINKNAVDAGINRLKGKGIDFIID